MGLPVLGQGDGAGAAGGKGGSQAGRGGRACAMFPAAVPIPVPIPEPCSAPGKVLQRWGHRMGLTSFCFASETAFSSSAPRDLGPTGVGWCFTQGGDGGDNGWPLDIAGTARTERRGAWWHRCARGATPSRRAAALLLCSPAQRGSSGDICNQLNMTNF